MQYLGSIVANQCNAHNNIIMNTSIGLSVMYRGFLNLLTEFSTFSLKKQQPHFPPSAGFALAVDKTTVNF